MMYSHLSLVAQTCDRVFASEASGFSSMGQGLVFTKVSRDEVPPEYLAIDDAVSLAEGKHVSLLFGTSPSGEVLVARIT